MFQYPGTGDCYKVTLEHSLLEAEKSQFSQPAEVFESSDYFCGLFWSHSNRLMAFLRWRCRDGSRSVGEVSPEQSKGAESSPWVCCSLSSGCIPGCGWLSEVVWGVQDRVLHCLGVGGGQAADCGNGKEQANFSSCFHPREANAENWQLEESQVAAYDMKETLRGKSGERYGEIPSKSKALCWRTHLDPICCPLSLEMHQCLKDPCDPPSL